MAQRCLARPTRRRMLLSDIRYLLRQITPARVAEVFAGIAFIAAVFLGFPIMAAMFVG